MEINEKYPPPMLFNLPYSPSYRYNGDGCSGQSLCTLDALRARHDYALVELDYINAFLVPRECGLPTISPEQAYRAGYADRPDRKRRFPWNADYELLQGMPADEAVRWVEHSFREHQGSFFCSSGSERLSS